jgi:hypothetical protein
VSNFNGKGGGNPDYGQGFIPNEDIGEEEIKNFIKEQLKVG